MRTSRHGRRRRTARWMRDSLTRLRGHMFSQVDLWKERVEEWVDNATYGWGENSLFNVVGGAVLGSFIVLVLTEISTRWGTDEGFAPIQASFSTYVAAVFQEDRQNNIDFVADAESLIAERIGAYGSVTTTTSVLSSDTLFPKIWKLYTGSIQFEEYTTSSKQFLERLKQSVQHEEVHNSYAKAAVTQLSGELRRVIMRGLSDVYDVTQPEEEQRFIAEVGCVIKKGRQTELAGDVMYMCVSYRHQSHADGSRIVRRCTRQSSRMVCTCNDVPEYNGCKDVGMHDEDWRQVYLEARRCALMAGVNKISLWVDKQVYRGDYSWIALGLVPYLVFPTIRSKVAGTEDDRLWLRLEEACAKIGPGITRDWNDDIDMLQHLVITRTPVESFLTVCELVRGRGCDRYRDPSRTTFVEDLERLRLWADGVVRCGSASVILETPMEDLSWVKSGRRDCSHLAIYDDDVEDVRLVVDYKEALSAEETAGGAPWRVEQLLLHGDAVEVEAAFVEKLKAATVVTEIDERNGLKTFLVVTLTMGGCMASRVMVSYAAGHEQGHVLSSRKDARRRQRVTEVLRRRRAQERRELRSLADFRWR